MNKKRKFTKQHRAAISAAAHNTLFRCKECLHGPTTGAGVTLHQTHTGHMGRVRVRGGS